MSTLVTGINSSSGWVGYTVRYSVVGQTGITFNWETFFEPPLDVPCPICKTSVGISCKKLDRNKRWSKKRKYNEWYSFTYDKLPHKERIKESTIKAVTEALDR